MSFKIIETKWKYSLGQPTSCDTLCVVDTIDDAEFTLMRIAAEAVSNRDKVSEVVYNSTRAYDVAGRVQVTTFTKTGGQVFVDEQIIYQIQENRA